MEIKNEKFVFTKMLNLKLCALILQSLHLFFAKEWDVTVGRTTAGDILRSKEKWMSHEHSGRAEKYGKLEEALMLWFN